MLSLFHLVRLLRALSLRLLAANADAPSFRGQCLHGTSTYEFASAPRSGRAGIVASPSRDLLAAGKEVF